MSEFSDFKNAEILFKLNLINYFFTYSLTYSDGSKSRARDNAMENVLHIILGSTVFTINSIV